MKFTIFLSFTGYLTIFGLGIVALIGFIIGWKFSNFLIPPRDYWVKSGLALFGTKLGIALGGAYFAVWGISALISAIIN